MRITNIVTAASTVALTLAAPGLAAAQEAPGNQNSAVTIERIVGADRYETSAAVAAATKLDSIEVPAGAPDALVAALGAAHSGKSAVLSRTDMSLGGEDRYESAANIAKQGKKNAPVVVVNGHSVVDILSAASYAANKGANLVLSATDQLPSATTEALETLSPSSVTIIGGEGVVNAAVAQQLQELTGHTPQRLSGKTRYSTAIATAQASGAQKYLLVNGVNPVDSFTLGPLAKQRNAAVILVRANCAYSEVLNFLNGKEYSIIGGQNAVGDNFSLKTCEQQDAEDAEAARVAAQQAAAAQAARKAAEEAARNPYGAGTPRGIAYDMLAQFGWGTDQMQYADLVFNYESKWNPQAGNPYGPYGIPQANPGTKMASAGADWATNPATQIRWGFAYIQGRYGSPAGAWAHIQRTGWY